MNEYTHKYMNEYTNEYMKYLCIILSLSASKKYVISFLLPKWTLNTYGRLDWSTSSAWKHTKIILNSSSAVTGARVQKNNPFSSGWNLLLLIFHSLLHAATVMARPWSKCSIFHQQYFQFYPTLSCLSFSTLVARFSTRYSFQPLTVPCFCTIVALPNFSENLFAAYVDPAPDHSLCMLP